MEEQEKSKYYTTDIEDLRVGYECEIRQMISNIGLYAKIKGEEDSYQSFCTPVIVGKEYPIPEDDEFTIAKLEAVISNWYNKNPSVNQAIELLKKGKLQTPYLTKEQIEAEGWIHNGGQLVSWGNQSFEKDNYFLILYPKTHQISIIFRDPSKELGIQERHAEHFNFSSYCPSINEFRQIIKLLNIK